MRTLALMLGLAGCSQVEEPAGELLTPAEVADLVRSDASDPESWGRDVHAALEAAARPVDVEHACQVLAILEQESGYDPDPAVPGLSDIVQAELDAELARLGPLAAAARKALVPPEYAERLDEVRTEREVDELFRDILAHHEGKAPAVAKIARKVFPRAIERLNPVATAGSMQVSVRWAQRAARREGLDRDTVRDLLYTRTGGVRWGTARLFSYDAPYDAPIYRFADYNLGPFASRNAAFQEQLAEVTGLELALDGDLLLYEGRGDSETLQALLAWRALHAPELSERRCAATPASRRRRTSSRPRRGRACGPPTPS